MKLCPIVSQGTSFNEFSFIQKLSLVFCFSYRGGIDSEGRPVMVVVGAHFLLRCLDLERFILYVVKVPVL